MIDTQITDISSLFISLSKLSRQNKQAVADLNQTISSTLGIPLQAIIEATEFFQEKTLSPRQQKEFIANIQHLANEMRNIINNFVNISQIALSQENDQANTEEVPVDISNLIGVQTLLIDNVPKRRKILQAKLQALGLICSVSTIEEALPALQQALQANSPYQMVIVSDEHLDHHAAYLGRTIKANSLFHKTMPVLLLSTEHPLDFEIERAHFSGFTCILNQTQAFAKKLAVAWQTWTSKALFNQNTVANLPHILVVEDEPTGQFSMQYQLKELGFNVDIAADGRKALRLLENNHYDLIFMDIGLPDISGLEVTAEIRRREQGKHQTPIIGLTVYALEEDEKHGLDVGMDDYLVKPLLQNRLQGILQKWFNKY